MVHRENGSAGGAEPQAGEGAGDRLAALHPVGELAARGLLEAALRGDRRHVSRVVAEAARGLQREAAVLAALGREDEQAAGSQGARGGIQRQAQVTEVDEHVGGDDRVEGVCPSVLRHPRPNR